jgi:hypothetical protein
VPPSAAHPNTTAIGIADYGKLVALLGRAFDGTAQRGSTLPILYDEFGVESDVPAAKLGLYTGTEATSVHPVDETTQALYYNQALQLTFCQPNVIGLLLFHALDEPARSGWQSGLYYADGTPKSSIVLTRNAADATRRGIIAECPGLELTPKLTVSTTRTAVRGKVKVTLASTLDATYTLGLRRVGGGAPPVTLRGIVLGRRNATMRVPAKLRPGAYRWRAVATATQNVGPQFSRLAGAFTVR